MWIENKLRRLRFQFSKKIDIFQRKYYYKNWKSEGRCSNFWFQYTKNPVFHILRDSHKKERYLIDFTITYVNYTQLSGSLFAIRVSLMAVQLSSSSFFLLIVLLLTETIDSVLRQKCSPLW